MNVDDARNHADARKRLGENEKEAGADDNDAAREPGQPLAPFDTVQIDDLIEETELALKNAVLAKGTLPQDLVVFQGFLGEAHDPLNPNNRRLYLNLQFNEYIEFRSQDVVVYHSAKQPPLASMIIWLPRTAQIKHVRMQTLDLQRGFLQGNMGVSGAPQGLSSAGQASGGGSFLTCGGGSFLTCGGGSFLTCGGGSFLTCGGGSFLTCGGGSFLTCGGGSFLTCGGGSFLTCGGG
ncbi:MAG TPA: hypothetical protein VND68_11980 [Chloroflexia bacterium]|jgi:hypothetical protein|nr:hypothetical protein [Chloroflexia bacterium]